jgi:hypothetical protein
MLRRESVSTDLSRVKLTKGISRVNTGLPGASSLQVEEQFLLFLPSLLPYVTFGFVKVNDLDYTDCIHHRDCRRSRSLDIA